MFLAHFININATPKACNKLAKDGLVCVSVLKLEQEQAFM
jgi:hypothetical protein